jgi:hypothetical protein
MEVIAATALLKFARGRVHKSHLGNALLIAGIVNEISVDKITGRKV